MSQHINRKGSGRGRARSSGQWIVRIGSAAIAAFAASSAWYMLFAAVMSSLRGAGDTQPAMSGWLALGELARNLVVASVLALLVARARLLALRGAVSLAVLLWLAFPVVLLAGSVMWEGVPAALAVIHAGDWLVKLLLIAVISVVGRGGGERREAGGV